MSTLKLGSRGNEVKILQTKLHLVADGIFGIITEEAVKEFQKEHQIKPDGVVGPETQKHLNELTCSNTVHTTQIVKSTRTIKLLVCHCTASAYGRDLTVDDIRKMHTLPVSKGGRGWSDIGYHYVIYRDGSIHNGRHVNLVGAHVSGQNTHSIGIVYVGGLGPDGKAKDTRTEAQKKALVILLSKLKKLYPTATIHGHNEYANKACPCFKANVEYANIK